MALCVLGNVFIHPNATVHSSAVIGPNVSVGNGAQIGAGVRVCNSIILPGAELKVNINGTVSEVGCGEWKKFAFLAA